MANNLCTQCDVAYCFSHALVHTQAHDAPPIWIGISIHYRGEYHTDRCGNEKYPAGNLHD